MKNSWIKFAQKSVGEHQMTEQQMREISPDTSGQGNLKGLYWQMSFDSMLLKPEIVNEDKIIALATQQNGNPENIARSAYYEAYNGMQRAKQISKLIGSDDPQKIKEYLHEQMLKGISYDPSDPQSLEHERLHQQGGKLSTDQVINQLASTIQGNFPEEYKKMMASRFVSSWIQNRMKLYQESEWGDEFFAMYPEMRNRFQEWLPQMLEQTKAYQKKTQQQINQGDTQGYQASQPEQSEENVGKLPRDESPWHSEGN